VTLSAALFDVEDDEIVAVEAGDSLAVRRPGQDLGKGAQIHGSFCLRRDGEVTAIRRSGWAAAHGYAGAGDEIGSRGNQ
jgi:hypothetical protein